MWGYDLNHFDADSSFVSRPLPQALQPLPLLIDHRAAMDLDQLKAFLARMPADDVAQIALKLGFEFSGDELLRVSGQRFDRVTVR